MSYVGRVELEPSNYTASTLASALGTALTEASPNGYTYSVTYDNGTGTLSITTPAAKEYDWTGTWTLESPPAPSLAGTYDGVNPAAIRSEVVSPVAGSNNMNYTYTQNLSLIHI